MIQDMTVGLWIITLETIGLLIIDKQYLTLMTSIAIGTVSMFYLV